jgi:hypothetical protein
MGDEQDAVKVRVAEIFNALDAQTGGTFRVGLVGFGNADVLPRVVSALTNDPAVFYRGLDSLTTDGETEVGWRAIVDTAIDSFSDPSFSLGLTGAPFCSIMITDENSDVDPRRPATQDDAITTMVATQGIFFGIVLEKKPSLNAWTDYDDIATATNGDMFDLNVFTTDPSSVLDAVLRKCVAVATQLQLAPSQATTKYVGEQHTVTATISATSGKLVEDVLVTFTIIGSSDSARRTCNPGSCRTDSNGEVALTYSGPQAGFDRIEACFIPLTTGTPFCQTADVNWIATQLQLAPSQATKNVGEQHTVTFTISDTSGNLNQNKLVTFTITGISGTVTRTCTPGTCRTDSNGEVALTYTSLEVGFDRIEACYIPGTTGARFCETAEVNWVVTELQLAPSQAAKNVGEQHTVTATISDTSGNLIQNEFVTFTITGNSGSATGTCTPGTCRTDSNGEVALTYRGQQAGVNSIEACFIPGTIGAPFCQTANVNWVGTQLQLAPSQATKNVGEQHTVTATITDTLGNLIQNELVTFAITSSSGSASGTCNPGTCRTDSNGEVVFTYTGQEEGFDTIEACFTSGTAGCQTSDVNWVGRRDPGPAGGRNRICTTGRGAFKTSPRGKRIRFFFTAVIEPDDLTNTPWGEMTLGVIGTGFRFVSDNLTELVAVGDDATLLGTGKLNGGGGYSFNLQVFDRSYGNDSLRVRIMDGDGTLVYDSDGEVAVIAGGSLSVRCPGE